MTLTIQNIIDEIIGDVGGDTTDTELAAKMLNFLKSALRKVPAFIKSQLLITQEDLTLAANAQTLNLTTLTAGIIKPVNVWYLSDTLSRISINKPPSREYFHGIRTTSSGAPLYYIVNGKTMYFDKKNDVSRTIGLEYFKEVSAVAVGDTFFGDDTLLEAVKELCKEGYFRDYEEDKTKADDHKIEAKRILDEIEADYETQEFGGHVKEGGSY